MLRRSGFTAILVYSKWVLAFSLLFIFSAGKDCLADPFYVWSENGQTIISSCPPPDGILPARFHKDPLYPGPYLTTGSNTSSIVIKRSESNMPLLQDSDLKKAKKEAQETLELCKTIMSFDNSEGTVIPASGELLKFCQQRPKFGYLVFPKFLEIVRIAKTRSQTFHTLNTSIFAWPVENIIKADQVASFEIDQRLSLLEFLLYAYVVDGFHYEKTYKIPEPEKKFAREFLEVSNKFLDDYIYAETSNKYTLPKEEEELELFRDRAISLKEILNKS